MARTVSDLLGAGAKLAALQQDDQGNPTGFEVRQIPTTKVASSAGYRAKIERTIGTVHQGRWRARWDLEADRVHFELRPKFPTNIWLPRASVDTNRDVLASYDKVKIDYGVDEDGNILHWQPAIDPNLMVVGAPGTGKTVLEHDILVSVSQWGWPIWVVDIAATLPNRRQTWFEELAEAESGSETRVRLFLQRQRIGVRAQMVVPEVGRVDLLVGRSLILECDSEAHHGAPQNQREDRRRDLAARDAGYDTIRLSYQQVWHQWDSTQISLMRHIRTRGHLQLPGVK